MDVGVNGSCRHDEPIAGDDGGSGPCHHRHVVHRVGVARSAEAGDPAFPDPDARLAAALYCVEHDGVRDHEVTRLRHCCRLQVHAVTGGLAEAHFELVTPYIGISLDP